VPQKIQRSHPILALAIVTDPQKLDVTKVEFCAKKKGSNEMKQSRFSETENQVLKEAEGEPVKTVCARHISAKRPIITGRTSTVGWR